LTYTHLQSVVDKLGVELKVLKSKKYDGMVDLAKKKQRFPSMKARFCTEELKVKPFIDWILDEVQDNFLAIQGIRAGESAARAQMSAGCRMFKYYLEPYGHDKHGKPKFHKHRRKDVLKFLDKYDDSIWRPFFDKTGQDVIDYIVEHGHEPNPLYKMGMKRVGCFPCINANIPQLKQLHKRFPERMEEVARIEEEVGSTFFAPDKVPPWARENPIMSSMRDVTKYINGKQATIDMFEQEEDGFSCQSYYNQCE
jgi:3'-phosphoadenosine 5'-phosphosulfate sulfotransferase (PAPS reductase)/FAD synthetase